MIWFTADQHFGHEEIISHCQRPFKNAAEMDRAIIRNFKNMVKPEDTTYFLGDLTMKGPEHIQQLERIIKQLPGTKVLILGNHDKLRPFQYVDMGFQSVHTSLELDTHAMCQWGGATWILNHDPSPACMFPSRIFICGHVHNLFRSCKWAVNVGVDVWGYSPCSILEVLNVKRGGATNAEDAPRGEL